MGKRLGRLFANPRRWVQALFTAATNGYAVGFLRGRIYTGKLKGLCVPGLNCYSCPGALGSCPIGALQAVLGSRDYHFAFYVFGTMMVIGAVFGRFVCGWLCPFGLVQDLLFKIPFVRKLRQLPGDRYLKWLKYVILVVLVLLLPLLAVDLVGQGQPWFCKYVCPSGTLMAGLPLVGLNPGLREAVGGLFAWKVGLLAVLVVLSIAVYRPFCHYLCPLGAIYGLFNPIAFHRYRINVEQCVACGKCQHSCRLNIPVYRQPNSPECIRCGKCRKACPTGAIEATWTGFAGAKRKKPASRRA